MVWAGSKIDIKNKISKSLMRTKKLFKINKWLIKSKVEKNKMI